VHLPHDLERQLDQALTLLARSEGFEIGSHVVDAVGVCQACAGASRATRPANPPSRDR
jgi:Fe2+ or Zn2+ uptake regulation protein